MRFTNHVALVAGGTGGLGRAVSLAFLTEGARVVVTYRDDREFAELQRLAGDGASRLVGRKADVTDEAAVQQLIDGITAEYGQLDALVNAVGGFAGEKNLWETELSVVDKMMALNLRSGLLLARAAAKAMLLRGKGVILNVASKSAVDHDAGVAAYAASKAAALALMDSLAAELKGRGVRVNSLLPSIIDTEANRKAMPDAEFARWPKPEEIARVVLFLCSEDAAVIHGAAIPVYGNS
jgi:NAD(P)-dependent dehydrogenase (short-subunit alcohol dehydrogenase family)